METTPIKIGKNNTLKVYQIDRLPPALMKGTQIPLVLKSYMSESPQTKELDSVSECIANHAIRVLRLAANREALIVKAFQSADSLENWVFELGEKTFKGQNHYINHR